ncbi:hypothetical protein KI387_043947 [Taxus chinensis]|uniref:Uncharacterized protein n=1 Tax=Taxus chinensis TaxID=29808 RepID=A0AA38GC40_TAXCH|nr:hypothetical protein KI387_043947 [Taxus chinensis]
MTSYLVYATASQGVFSKLDRCGVLSKDAISECYPQLTVPTCEKDFKVVNDEIFYDFICRLEKDLKANRVSKEAWGAVSKVGSLLIQFADFTYLRVISFSGEPVTFPRYPNDRLITMELSRQLMELHDLQSKRHKSMGFFPIIVGHYSFHSIHRARGMETQMLSKYEQEFFLARLNFDPFGVARKTISQEYAHVPSLEDFWMKCKSEYDVRQRDFSRLSAKQVFEFGLAWILVDLKDDGNVGYCLDEVLMNQVTGNFGIGNSLKRKHKGESSRRSEKLKVHRRSQSKKKITSTTMALAPASLAPSTSPTIALQQDTSMPPLNPATFIFSPQPLCSTPLPEETLKLQMAEFERALSLDDSEDDSHNIVALSDGEDAEREMVVHSVTSHSPRSNFLEWLASQMVPEVRMEMNLKEHDLQLLQNLSGRDKRPKVAKVTSRLIIEDSREKFAEMSIPAEGKEDELTAEDVTVTKVPLGQATTEGLKQDTQTLIDALFLRLDSEKVEKQELQK